MFKKIFSQLFAFLSSVQLAILVLSALAIVLAYGTYVEAEMGADYAAHIIYATPWFIAILALLGINVFCAGMSRWPWKRHHTGFLVVHLGLIILLIGSGQTLLKGYEGQLVLSEGENSDRIRFKENQFIILDTTTGELEKIPTEFRFDAPTEKKPFGALAFEDLLLKVDDYYNSAQGKLEVKETQGLINPAVEVELSGANATLKEWLFSRDFQRQSLSLGPATVHFIESIAAEDVQKILEDEKLRGPLLWVEGEWYPLEENFEKEITLSNGRTLNIENFYPNARVDNQKVININERPLNPALKLTLHQGQKSEEHTLFAYHPDISFVHQRVFEKPTPMRLFWVPLQLGKNQNELLVSRLLNGNLHYAIRQRGKWQKSGAAEVNQAIATGWMDFKFEILQKLNRAQSETTYRNVPVLPNQDPLFPPAVKLTLAYHGSHETKWLEQNKVESFQFQDKEYKVVFTPQTKDLGFALRLKKFEMPMYEGTQNPASFASHVEVIDPEKQEDMEYTISMNHPLKKGKYKLFQASYQTGGDGTLYPVLAVAYDPGIFLKYLGSIILVLGIVLIFWFRKAFLKKKAKTI